MFGSRPGVPQPQPQPQPQKPCHRRYLLPLWRRLLVLLVLALIVCGGLW
ncbi:hypothetical protein [Streptomyces sp. NPDC059076]